LTFVAGAASWHGRAASVLIQSLFPEQLLRLSLRVVHHHALRDQRDASIASLLGRAFSRSKLNLFPLFPYVGAAAQVKRNFKPIAEFLMPWSILLWMFLIVTRKLPHFAFILLFKELVVLASQVTCACRP
jgi:MFS-type transporter involved in bile tolerance (Atg22 family)